MIPGRPRFVFGKHGARQNVQTTRGVAYAAKGRFFEGQGGSLKAGMTLPPKRVDLGVGVFLATPEQLGGIRLSRLRGEAIIYCLRRLLRWGGECVPRTFGSKNTWSRCLSEIYVQVAVDTTTTLTLHLLTKAKTQERAVSSRSRSKSPFTDGDLSRPPLLNAQNVRSCRTLFPAVDRAVASKKCRRHYGFCCS